ncbi:MAG: BtpA/SgcQ family protein [Deltaproteobacteria bacterium]|nr:BtpA/SgcQ family protein [Deltaproteobacteria bacterium]
MRVLRQHPERPLLIGMVHLLPLPGAPTPSPGLAAVQERALADAVTLQEGGADGMIVENYGDTPFTAGQVDAWTVAAMTRIAIAVRQACPEALLGVNVLRNDAQAALAVAAASGADFIRVNIHTGTMATDQGLITGEARQTLLERNRLGASVAVAADVLVKHAAPLSAISVEEAARDTWFRGRADALIITGSATGQPLDPTHLQKIRNAIPEATLWAGSGLNPSTGRACRDLIDGAIVGTWLRGGDLTAPVDPERVRQMREALGGELSAVSHQPSAR